MKQHIALATESDYPKLKDFAEKVGVEWSDSGDDTHFFMLEKSELAASIGVKMVEDKAILRALIIDPEQCGLGETMYLLNAACEKANRLGAEAAYLLTAVPSYIFQLSGFTEIEWAQLPEALLSENPFDRLNELKNATIMMKFLND